MKKTLSAILALALTVSLAACSSGGQTSSAQSSGSSAQAGSQTQSGSVSYPTQNINGIVQWGAGGGTDSLMRPLAALAEQELGASIVIQNKPVLWLPSMSMMPLPMATTCSWARRTPLCTMY